MELEGKIPPQNTTRAGDRQHSSVVEHTTSCKGLRFDSQHPRGGSLPSLTTVAGDLTPSFDLQMRQAHTDTRHALIKEI